MKLLVKRPLLGALILAGPLVVGLAAPAQAQNGNQAERSGAWVVKVEHLGPRGDFEEVNRDISITVVEGQRAWSVYGPFEVRAGGGVAYATGTTSEPFSGVAPQEVNTTALTAGVEVRLNMVQTETVGVYVDGSANVLWSPGDPFPPGGTGVNGFVRFGVGASYQIRPGLSLEAGYHWAHISNGAGVVEHNPAWNGHGGVVAVRFDRSF